METLTHVVKLPLGIVVIELNREGLELSNRGGFEVRWGSDEDNALGLEAYRNIIKNHVQEVYKKQTGQEAPTIMLNLASHQIVDDIVGWSKLNYQARPPSH